MQGTIHYASPFAEYHGMLFNPFPSLQQEDLSAASGIYVHLNLNAILILYKTDILLLQNSDFYIQIRLRTVFAKSYLFWWYETLYTLSEIFQSIIKTAWYVHKNVMFKYLSNVCRGQSRK